MPEAERGCFHRGYPHLFGCILQDMGHAIRPNMVGGKQAAGFAADGASGDPGCHRRSFPATASEQQHRYMALSSPWVIACTQNLPLGQPWLKPHMLFISLSIT